MAKGGIAFGAGGHDTNLYRQSANVLVTDDLIIPDTVLRRVGAKRRTVMGVFPTYGAFGWTGCETICVPPPGIPVGAWRGYGA